MKCYLLFFLLLLCLLSIGCSKETKCKDLVNFPCYEYDGENSVSSFEGTYNGEDVCIFSGVDKYKCEGTRYGISTSDANGGNVVQGGYYGSIKFKSDNLSYTTPVIKINTPIVPHEEDDNLTLNKRINERIQYFNIKSEWKLGSRLTNHDKDYLSIEITFNCEEWSTVWGEYQLGYDSDNDLLDSDSFVKIKNFEMDRKNGDILYDITFDIDTYLYDPNCIRNCRRERLDVEWRAIFSVPEK